MIVNGCVRIGQKALHKIGINLTIKCNTPTIENKKVLSIFRVKKIKFKNQAF
jgi:hypothetical protein